MSNRIKRTEVDGLEASWTLDNHEIGIVGVYDISGNQSVVSIDHGPYPDLAEAREQWPGLTPLWNAVRDDYWSEIVSPDCSSHGPHAEDP